MLDDAIKLTPSIEEKNNILSIIVPVFNEETVIEEFYKSLSSVLDRLTMQSQIIFVNDGSQDRTLLKLQALQKTDRRIELIDLSRNFGKEIAMTAGFDHAVGDAIVTIDADLQDPPELIEDFIRKWHEGYDVVYAKRVQRLGDSLLKRITAFSFYKLINRVSKVSIPEHTGDFRLISRRALIALNSLRERHRFMKGLFAWIGYPQIGVEYTRTPRYSGSTKWSYWQLWNFALEGFTSFTTAPLKVATYVGILIAVAAFIYGSIIILKTLFIGNPVPGYPSLMVVILFLGGVQLMALGIIGEYIARMFDESKKRPLYIIRNTYQHSMLDMNSNSKIMGKKR